MVNRLRIVTCALLIVSQFTFFFERVAESQTRRRPKPTVNETIKGLQLKLSDGAPVEARPAPLTSTTSTKLSEDEAQVVLKRLRPIKSEPDDQQDFALRDRSLPPPRNGKTITDSFPPTDKATAPDAATGPLEVLRYSPEGDVPLVPQLSVTFSQPMVAITSHQDTIADRIPVKLTPLPPGHWRWVGTKTLLFETEGHFPMATEYTAEVPAGTKSATGATLVSSKVWKFTTAPLTVKSYHPVDAPTTRDPLIFVEFDQRINPSAVAEKIVVQSGKRVWRVQLATGDEIKADETVNRLVEHATKDRWVAFRVVNPANAESPLPLPVDAPVTVTIPADTPSMEGPRTTIAPQSFSFHTFGSLRVVEHRCGYHQPCSPFDDWSIRFTNPIDSEAFEQSQVRVEEITHDGKKSETIQLKSAVYGDNLNISGIKRGRTSYRVTLDHAVRDQFGQTLGQTAPLVFDVGPATPALAGPDKQFVVLDPAAPPRLSVYSINQSNLKLRLYSVGPEHWRQFLAYMRKSNDRVPMTPPGRLAVSKLIPVNSRPDEMTETRIDLSPALDRGFGQVIVIVEPTTAIDRRYRNQVIVWAQVTQIGLDAFVDSSELIAWATSLKDGKPIEGVRLDVTQGVGLSFDGSATSREAGIAHISLKSSSSNGPRILVARKGRDVAILPENTYWWNERSGWIRRVPGDSLRWFVFDDRQMYKPGEEVHVKGWIRRVGDGTDGDVGPLEGAASSVTYIVKDSSDNEVLKGTAQINALGGFDTAFKLPATMNLGYSSLNLEANANVSVSNRDLSHEFQVQEFRRPEFEVTTQASEGPHFVGSSATATVNAAYYASGGLANSDVTWQVTTSTARFTPPNRDDFNFGKWIPWWIGSGYSPPKVETFTGRTDAVGKHTLRMDFVSVDPPLPSTVNAQASVTDVNRQAWTASSNLLVHPADLYVGIRSPRTFVQKGEPLIVQSIVADLDGKLIAGREIKLRAVLMDWVFEKGEWKQQEKNPQECVVRSSADPVECRFETREGGQYKVTATIEDDHARKNESELTLWVAGGKLIPKRDVEQEAAQLIPDRKEYRAGDTAEILVQAPFYPAEAVMTLRRSGIVSTERFTMDGPSHTLRVPIKEGYTPNLYVQVDLVGAAVRTDNEGNPLEKLPKRPAFATGALNLQVPPLARKLQVEAKPRDKALEPGGETTVDVEVRDATGKPVAGSELAVVVVDEAVLALTAYRIGDPIATFYAQRGAEVRDHHSRASLLLAAPESLEEKLQRSDSVIRLGGGGGGGRGRMAMAAPAKALPENGRAFDSFSLLAKTEVEQIRMRENFNALATFAPAVPTDANGHATVKVKMPDSLTRYRVMAVAVAGGKQFGGGESTINARLPLMIRPSAPRFLNFGDKCELPVVIQNQTDSPMETDVAVRASNAELTEGSGRRLTVPANDRVEVRFPVSAARAGTARFQIAGVSGKWADAAEIELPVWTPATTEAFATYGEIDEGAITQPVKAPSDAIKQFGGLEITTSSTELQALTDAVLYLVAYPFECSEQLSSRVLAIAALKDVLAAFKAKGLPEPKEMITAVDRDLKRLESMENEDGGFGFWHRGDESWPYLSIHVAHALARAKEKGFEVPVSMTDRSKKYLRDIEHHIPDAYGPIARRSLIAYSLYVRNLMGDRDTAKARILIAGGGLDGLSLEGLGWLLSVLSGDATSSSEVAAIRKHLNNHVTEEASTASFVTSYGDNDYLLLHSDRRTDGVILEALITDQPSSDLIPKLVRGLLGHRKAGRWENTQENALVLLALDKYFATYEKVTPDFIAQAWLGEDYAGKHKFQGRSTDRYNVNVAMRVLAEGGASKNLILSKEGPGRLYYRIGMQYAPANLKLDPSEHGFTVERVYEAVDKPDDVRRDSDGVWHIKAGTKVRVKLTMVAPSRRYHVALVDPIPAGLEAMNPALAVTGNIPQDPKEATNDPWWWLRWPWFEHQNMRDERVEAFASLVWEGVHTYSYVARATTPGIFIVPPTKAEEMYHPETFGRGPTDRVIVE
jgi:uncharacterized protein YfaS (alpha-2-macroglobulin family)